MTQTDKPTDKFASHDVIRMTAITIPSSTQPLLPQRQNISATSNASLTTKGFLLMVCSALCQSLVAFLVHIAETQYSFPSPTALFLRCVTSVVFSLFTLVFFSTTTFNSLLYLPWQLWGRGIMGGLATVTSFSALKRLPVGTATTLFYLSPAITSIAAATILHDTPLTLPLGATVIANFIGVALVSQPAVNVSVTPQWWVGVICAICTAFLSASVFILQRSLGTRTHVALSVLSYGFGCGVAAIGWIALTGWKEFFVALTQNWKGALIILVSGVAGFGSQIFLNLGLQRAPAGPSIIVRSLSVPFSFTLGFFVLGESVGPMSIFGVVIVLSSVAAIGRIQLVAKRDRERNVELEINDSGNQS